MTTNTISLLALGTMSAALLAIGSVSLYQGHKRRVAGEELQKTIVAQSTKIDELSKQYEEKFAALKNQQEENLIKTSPELVAAKKNISELEAKLAKLRVGYKILKDNGMTMIELANAANGGAVNNQDQTLWDGILTVAAPDFASAARLKGEALLLKLAENDSLIKGGKKSNYGALKIGQQIASILTDNNYVGTNLTDPANAANSKNSLLNNTFDMAETVIRNCENEIKKAEADRDGIEAALKSGFAKEETTEATKA